MIHGFHIIFCTYGFWLPNDPRGSKSDYVGSSEIYRHGASTKTDSRRSVACRSHDSRRRFEAKNALKYSPVSLTGKQAQIVGKGFAEYARKKDFKIWACSILPNHVHLATEYNITKAEYLAQQLKASATRALIDEDLHPMKAFKKNDGRFPTFWSRGQWIVYLNARDDVRRVIEYVEANPVKDGKRKQNWSCVTKYG